MGGTPLTPFESEVQATAAELLSAGAGERPALYAGVNGLLLEHAMADPRLSQALFRFVDVLPQLQRLPDVDRAVAKHLAAYLDEADAHDWLAEVIRWGAHPGLAWMARRQVRALARQFLAEEKSGGLEEVLVQLATVPAQTTVDAVGEAVLSEAEADAYRDRNLALLDRLAAANTQPHLSLKLTALTPRFDPLDAKGTRQRVFARLAPIVEKASVLGATLTIDMEQYELKPLILQFFIEALQAFNDPRWHPAIALQAYLPDSSEDCRRVSDAGQHHGRRLGIRLVKGAYWDQEAAWAAQRGWPQPTWCEKTHTDWHYEQLTAFLLDHSDSLKPAIAGHNLRSQAVALTHARRRGLAASAWEVQMLLGMAEPLRDALASSGVPLRIYVPVGDAEIGIAYLIRRLLENTASTSILRRAHIDGEESAALLLAPSAPPEPVDRYPEPGFRHLPLLDFSRQKERETFALALAEMRSRVESGEAADAKTKEASALSRNPAQPEEILGNTAITSAAEAEIAIARARTAFADWSVAPALGRAAILREVAHRIEAERYRLAALQALECGKPWREADADIAEAVDFLRYYALEMEKLDGWQVTTQFPGEDNRLRYAPRGVAVVIAPWNFPLAILAGMSAAALVAGNTVLMKPALPALLIAREYLRILHESGLPDGVCQLLVGGPELGAQLVAHRDVNLIAFTGSRQVGLAIQQAAHTPQSGQFHVKQVVCEMGGKNAIVVDDDADLDEAVAGIIASAFGYSGQKCSACSRVIAVGKAYAALCERLPAAAAALAWGPPEDPAFDHGPLITQEAQAKALAYIAIGKTEGELIWQGRVPEMGWYAPPSIFAGIRPEHRLAREEVFGPVLALLQAPDFVTAINMANDSEYALTGGVYSRLPEHLDHARRQFLVGNLYLNRKITGARVSVQPFGGVRLSGTGVQAGGPDYLKQFLWSRSISENTMRHGFIA